MDEKFGKIGLSYINCILTNGLFSVAPAELTAPTASILQSLLLGQMVSIMAAGVQFQMLISTYLNASGCTVQGQYCDIDFKAKLPTGINGKLWLKLMAQYGPR